MAKLNWGGGAAGAATGAVSGAGPWGALIGGLTGLLGGGTREDPVMKQQRLQQQQIANRLYNFGTSVPGSSADELSSLAEQRGQLGAAQRANQQRVFGAYNPANAGTSATSLLSNLGNANIAQQMALTSNASQGAMEARRAALQQAAGIGQGAAALYHPIQNQFPAIASQLTQMLAYRNAMKQQQPGAQTQHVDMNTGWNPANTGPGTTAQYPGNTPTQPGAIDWNALTASGALGNNVPMGQPDDPLFGGPQGMDPNLLALLHGALGGAGPAGSLTPGASGPTSIAGGSLGLPNEWQTPSWPPASIQALNAQTGRMAPGQTVNAANNQMRQPVWGPMANGLVAQLMRSISLPGGARLRF